MASIAPYLDSRDLLVLGARLGVFGRPLTLEETAMKVFGGLTRERIRQMQQYATSKLPDDLRDKVLRLLHPSWDVAEARRVKSAQRMALRRIFSGDFSSVSYIELARVYCGLQVDNDIDACMVIHAQFPEMKRIGKYLWCPLGKHFVRLDGFPDRIRFNRGGGSVRCIDCETERQKRYRRSNPEVARRAVKKREDRIPEARRAYSALRNAIKTGAIIKPSSCSRCGKECEPSGLHGHHKDYLKPLEVEWMCPRCHALERSRL
jgi:hypothetical protein